MSNDIIRQVKARELLDSKGRPMIEVEVTCADGAMGSGAAPCGTTVGSHEGFVLRDGDAARFNGLGTQKAVQLVETSIAPALIGQAATCQEGIDSILCELDGTVLKSKLGANTVYSVSIAVARAAAASLGIPLYEHFKAPAKPLLPYPLLNIINGGEYGDINCAVQEFMTFPLHKESFAECYRKQVEIFYAAGKVIKKRGKNLYLGNSIGHAAPYTNTADNIEVLLEAIALAGYEGEFAVALDCAANEMFADNTYHLDGKALSRDELIAHWLDLVKKYPIKYIEDPFFEDDFAAHTALTAQTDILVCGDDLIATTAERVFKAASEKSVNCMVFKPNMIGTVTEAFVTAEAGRKCQYDMIPSIRSGGGVDDPIIDFSLALGAPFIKCGGPRSGERIAVQNKLLRLSEEFSGGKLF